jgi:mono/diheme cytochrome c family protein
VPDKAQAIANGRGAVRGAPPMNPPLWSMAALDGVWKQWGRKEKPADFDRALRERYGLHTAPYANNGLPMGLHISTGIFGKGVVNDCLLCHSGQVAGQTIIGLGNASLDLQSMFDDLGASAALPFKFPMSFSHVRGTVDPISPVGFLMGFRAPDLSLLKKPIPLDYFDNVCSDPPAWWLIKKKKTRDWNGGIDARSMRIDMVNLLSPFNSREHIHKHEKTFADIHQFLLSVEAPKFPFPIDHALAKQGAAVFEQTCARCHGTYGPNAKYPNKIVPLATIGTDPLLAEAVTSKNFDYVNLSWLTQEKGPDGATFHVRDTRGYQAPPLDGVWATAPYFHNSSVPTIYHVVNSKSRPKYFTRSYQTGKDDYDATKLGWKISVLNQPPDSKLPAVERRKVYDTTLPGRHNTGHTFGDELTEAERTALLEYLKTL